MVLFIMNFKNSLYIVGVGYPLRARIVVVSGWWVVTLWVAGCLLFCFGTWFPKAVLGVILFEADEMRRVRVFLFASFNWESEFGRTFFNRFNELSWKVFMKGFHVCFLIMKQTGFFESHNVFGNQSVFWNNSRKQTDWLVFLWFGCRL